MSGVATLDGGMVHVLGRTEGEGVRFRHPTQNSAQFST